MAVVCVAAAGMLLGGCPQLLDDGFGRLATPAGDAGTESRVPPEDDNAAPRVVGSTPESGALGVSSDTQIEITFSKRMDTAATIAAYSSTDLPSSAVSFAWRDEDRVLVITPREPLGTASGPGPGPAPAPGPAGTAPRMYAITIGAGARDRAGNALAPAPATINFTTAREVELVIATVKDRTLTGNWRSDGVYGAADCQLEDTTVCAGDSVPPARPTYHGFLTFDLSGLPAQNLGITAAVLSLRIGTIYYQPFTALGALRVAPASFDAIGAAAFQAPPAPTSQVLATNATVNEEISVDATDVVAAATTGRAQFMLRFESDTNSDDLPDLIVCDWTTPTLRVTYRMP